MLETVTRTTCPYCGVGCGVLAKTHANGTVTVTGDAEHPANYGRLCSKGLSLGETFGLDQRLLKPRVDGHEVAWDDATSLVAQKFSNAIRDHGPDSVAFYVSGQFLTEDYYVANKLMKGFIGSANIDTNSRLCMASAVAGHKRAFGADIVPCNYTDLEEADLIVLVGSNLAWCHPVLFQRLQTAREKRGTKLVVIDPRRTMTAECADLHLPIKSGSDVSLFNGLLKEMHDRGAVDVDFVRDHTEGLAETLAAVSCHSDERVMADTGLPLQTIHAFYDLYARHAKTVTGFSMGVNQAEDGTDKVNAIINCHLLTGRIGKTGAGPFSITGQPNAMGGREVGGLANMLAAHMDLSNAEHRDAVQGFWASPRMAQNPGLKAVELFDAVRNGKIKALWIMATNPAVSMPNATAVADALKACPFVVVSDVTAHTETTQFAHVLLPAKGWGEKDGTVTNSERRISRQRAFRRAAGESKADWQIMCEVAKAMGFAGFDYHSPADVFAEHVALTGVKNEGSRLLDLTDFSPAKYDEMQPQQWGGERPFAAGQFETASGKARFVPTLAKQRQVMDGHFTLNTGRIRDQWHTMTRTGQVPKLFTHRAEPYLEISHEAASKLGIGDADLVTVKGENGTSVVRALLSDGVGQGQVFQPMHWSGQFASAGLANAASVAMVDPVSGQPALKSSEVSIARYPARWFGFGVSADRLFLTTDYWALQPLKTGISFECASSTEAGDWSLVLERQLGFAKLDFDLSVVTDKIGGGFRCTAFQKGALVFAFFADAKPVAASRHWLQGLLGQNVSASDVLAGRPGAAQVDHGAIVCACNGIGRNTIQLAIASQPAANLSVICSATQAGMGCGSCRPEVQKIIDSMAPLRMAAE